MERIDRICRHPLWRESLEKIRVLEKDRVFCGHDMAHFMDVARIAYIEDLERRMEISKESIYAAALLHDIGRHLQYLEGIPHEQGSRKLAGVILQDCGFDQQEMDEILDAICMHRDSGTKNRNDLAGLLYRADKRSRVCFVCAVSEKCNWDKNKK